jgi:hypothetical protein
LELVADQAACLPAACSQYEQESYEQLVKAIEGQDVLPQAVFTMLLKKIYKRQK